MAKHKSAAHNKNHDDKDQGDLDYKKYQKAADETPVGTVVWYWASPEVDPCAAIIAGRADAEHCHLLVITPLGQAHDRQNVLQGKAGDKAAGEYFLDKGEEALEFEPKTETSPATTDSEQHLVSASGGLLT